MALITLLYVDQSMPTHAAPMKPHGSQDRPFGPRNLRIASLCALILGLHVGTCQGAWPCTDRPTIPVKKNIHPSHCTSTCAYRYCSPLHFLLLAKCLEHVQIISNAFVSKTLGFRNQIIAFHGNHQLDCFVRAAVPVD